MEAEALYAGLTALNVGDRIIQFGHGLEIHSTSAYLVSSVTMLFEEPKWPLANYPNIFSASSKNGEHEISAELFIPSTYSHPSLSRFEVARSIVCLLRLFSDPEIRLAFLSQLPLASIPAQPRDSRMIGAAVELHERHFQLGLATHTKKLESLNWVVANWEAALDLIATSSEFKFAMEVFEIGQFIPSTAMTLVSIWGALEAIFSPSTTELRFRVSALIAAYLKPPGEERLAYQQKVAKLYDKRSAAAHGKPKHDNEDLLASFELLRAVLVRIIESRGVPSKDTLDRLLFGAIKKQR